MIVKCIVKCNKMFGDFNFRYLPSRHFKLRKMTISIYADIPPTIYIGGTMYMICRQLFLFGMEGSSFKYPEKIKFVQHRSRKLEGCDNVPFWIFVKLRHNAYIPSHSLIKVK